MAEAKAACRLEGKCSSMMRDTDLIYMRNNHYNSISKEREVERNTNGQGRT